MIKTRSILNSARFIRRVVYKHPVQLDCMVELVMMLIIAKGRLTVCLIRQRWSAKKRKKKHDTKS